MTLKRVNAARPCLICGKKTWCGYNDKISLCSRITLNATRISTSGQGIFETHQQDIEPQPAPSPLPSPVSINPELTHQVFSLLPQLSPLTARLSDDLARRGIQDQSPFWTFPGKESNRWRLVQQLLRRIPLTPGVPGFWRNTEGWMLGWPGTTSDALAIPIRNREGQIKAIQLRYTTTNKDLRYRWLSTPKLPDGAKSGTPIHYIWPTAEPQRILLIEGALKAESLHTRYPQHAMAAIAGIAYGHNEVLSLAKNIELTICFDQDPLDSGGWVEVQFQAYSLLEKRLQEGTLIKTFVAKWSSNHKGIDDAANNGIKIKMIPGADAHRELQKIDFSALRKIRLPSQSSTSPKY